METSTALAQLHRLRSACEHPWLVRDAAHFWSHMTSAFSQLPAAEEVPGELLPSGEEAAARALFCEAAEPEATVFQPTYSPSTKILAVLDILRLHPGEKVLVFSLWTSMLDLIEEALEAEGVARARLQGSMDSKQRQEAIHAFRSNPAIQVFLVSLMAGNQGLNLECASVVLLVEPHFNPMVEEQAIDRAHRIGQQRTVKAYKLFVSGQLPHLQKLCHLLHPHLPSLLLPLVELWVASSDRSCCSAGDFCLASADSVEEKVLELQDFKKQEIQSIIGRSAVRDSGPTGMKLSKDSLKYLLGLSSQGFEAQRLATRPKRREPTASSFGQSEYLC